MLPGRPPDMANKTLPGYNITGGQHRGTPMVSGNISLLAEAGNSLYNGGKGGQAE